MIPTDQPLLFDDCEGGAPCPEGAGESPARTPQLDDSNDDRFAWVEVPQATFLAWSEAAQLAYCAARDEDSARHEEDPERRAWFRERAASYRDLARLTLP